MIRQYSKKYFCNRCRKETGVLGKLYSEPVEGSNERGLFCEKHGFQQYCNCSPSELVLEIVPDKNKKT